MRVPHATTAGDLLVTGLVVAFALYFLVETRGLPGLDLAYPRAVITMILVLGAYNVVAALRPGRPTGRRADAATDEDEGVNGRSVVVLALLAAYVVGAQVVGFYPATFAFLVGADLAFGTRNPVLLLVDAGAVVVGVYLLFDRLLDVGLA